MNEELKQIKKLYGEEMAHLCRELFPTILEKEGSLLDLLITHFNPSKFLYGNIISQNQAEEFKNFIYNCLDEEKKEIETDKTPFELLSEAGYDLYECTTEEEIQRFKKYYAKGEELCTFRGGRLNSCHVFFAVKKDVDNIKREDFFNPERQDLYGTSVISIQFSRGYKNALSIKNRYNHTVNNPDATYGNNLENIIPGLTFSFNKHYKLDIESYEDDFELFGYIRLKGKYYKYNYEINNIYYCPDNIIIDNFIIKRYDPSRYLIIDSFILDLKQKTIELYDKENIESFTDDLTDIDKISVINTENGKEIRVTFKDSTKETVVIKINNTNIIIGYSNPNVENVKHGFLSNNRRLKELSLPNLKNVGNNFLRENRLLVSLSLPKLVNAEWGFLVRNIGLKELDLPELTTVGNLFLVNNSALKKVYLPALTTIGDNFLSENSGLKELNLPSLITVGGDFLSWNEKLEEVYMPSLISVGKAFLYYNDGLKRLNLPSLINANFSFLANNKKIKELNAPLLQRVGNDFLTCNNSLKKLSLPSLISVGRSFLYSNELLEELNAPNLKEIGDHFLYFHSQKNMFISSLGFPTQEGDEDIIPHI